MSQLMATKNRSAETLALLTESGQHAQSIVVVDAAANNYQYLLTNRLLGIDVHILDGQQDGITQLQTLLQQSQTLSSLHLICQGAPGQLQLGSTLLCEMNLWVYADDIRQWRSSLSDNAEILIYGCDLAANRVGQAFISWLKFLTGAYVHVY